MLMSTGAFLNPAGVGSRPDLYKSYNCYRAWCCISQQLIMQKEVLPFKSITVFSHSPTFLLLDNLTSLFEMLFIPRQPLLQFMPYHFSVIKFRFYCSQTAVPG